MKLISDLTYKIITLTHLSVGNTDEGVDWALEMMELGYESPSLFMLASFNKPTNFFETIGYIKDAIVELGIKLKNRDEALMCYASYYIKKIANTNDVRENLKLLYTFCLHYDYEQTTFNFYLLNWAWEDIEYGDIAFNHYWDGLDKDNIERIVVEEAKKWIANNYNIYKLV